MNEDEKKIKKAVKILDNFRKNSWLDSSPVSAATVLVFLGKPVEKTLLDALGDKSELVRHTSIIALGGLKSRKAIRLLTNHYITEQSDMVKASIVFSLKEIGKPAAKWVSSLINNPFPAKAISSMILLGEMGAVSEAPKLFVPLGSKEYRLWTTSAEALVKLGFYSQACGHMRQLIMGGSDRFSCITKIEYLALMAKKYNSTASMRTTEPIDFDKLNLKRFPRSSKSFTAPASKPQLQAKKVPLI